MVKELVMSKIRNIIIFLIILGIVIFAWNSFSSKDVPSDQLLTVENGSTDVLAGETIPGSPNDVGQSFLDTLLSLRTIKLDRSLLDRDSFKSLRDFTKELVQQNNQGRPNPFAPIGVDVEVQPSASPTPETSSLGASAGTALSLPTQTTSVTLETVEATAISKTSAILNGKLFSPSTTTVRYFEWGINPDALSSSTPQVKQTTPGVFNREISGLTPNTTYYFKAVAVTGASVSEGDIVVFTTLP